MLHEKIKKMKKLYAEKGYLKVDIRADLVDSKNKQNIFDGKAKTITKDIVFNIKENEKIRLRNIYFEGNDTYSDLKLRGDVTDLLVITLMAIALVPIQAGLEEVFFRGYLMQGFSLLIKSRLALLIVTSSIFASLHLMNPEPWSYGLLPYIVSVFLVGLFMGLITLVDGGVELAIGVHIANNLWVHLIVGLEESIIPSSSLFIADQKEFEMMSTILPSLIQYGILTGMFAVKYKWFQKLKRYPSL